MVFKKRRSAILEKAQSRLRGLQSVHLTMDLGNGLTLQSYASLLESSSARLQAYNLALAEADRARIEFAEIEASVSLLSSRTLSAVAAMYGKDSKEYEMAGGTPPGIYKRAKKQLPATTLSATQGSDNFSNPTSPEGTALNGAGMMA